MVAVLRLAVSHTDVASISWGLGEHYFTKAQVEEMHSILLAAEADHVTVVGSSGDGGWFPTPRGWGGQVKEVSLPTGDPLVLGVGGTALTANPKTGAYISESRLARFGWRLQPPVRPSCLSGRRPRDFKGEGRARRSR